MKYDLWLMLRKELLGVASLSIGNIGVAGLGVVDDVLLHGRIVTHGEGILRVKLRQWHTENGTYFFRRFFRHGSASFQRLWA